MQRGNQLVKMILNGTTNNQNSENLDHKPICKMKDENKNEKSLKFVAGEYWEPLHFEYDFPLVNNNILKDLLNNFCSLEFLDKKSFRSRFPARKITSVESFQKLLKINGSISLVIAMTQSRIQMWTLEILFPHLQTVESIT